MKTYYDEQQGMRINGNFWQVHPETGKPWDTDSIAAFMDKVQAQTDTIDGVDSLRQQVIVRIKQLAYKQLQGQQWRVERAKERELQATLSGNDAEATQQRDNLKIILAQREALRVKSDELEAEVQRLTTKAELLAYVIEF
ncbi:hypothetical protein EAG18_16145 [Pseudoalteromonas sp. J010]|uniref:hypothetical protein n=1 Tax=Pseudoalteromonas sp. J010 TaxID=998465 RepID=UPI000F6537CF|nr:hypothetical protein [Pseudoalteromonas sp. J010]RRS07628.1 hypothetical protein EAG18_16145 [Pseudoalteromonas sp. J010]